VYNAKKRIACCLVQLRKHSEAIQLQWDVLYWHERNHGCDAQSTVDGLYTMADMHLFARDYTKALNGRLRVLSWRKFALGKDHMKALIVAQ
jgi:hypothetical protein